MSNESYRKVIGGGLKLKGSHASAAKRAAGAGAGAGVDKAKGLTHTKFKKELPSHDDPIIDASTAAAASSPASSAAASSVGSIAPPVVLGSADAAAAAAKSTWRLHKDELHEIDAHQRALQEADRSIEKMEDAAKKERVAAEKRRAEQQVSNMVNAATLAPGVKFSVPSAANLNREYLFRTEAQVSDATARLDQRSKKKADRYCK